MTEARSSLAFLDGGLLAVTDDTPWTLGEALRRAARERPTHGFTYYDPRDGEPEQQSYPALLAEATTLARALGAAGLAPGSLVLLQLTANREILTAFWGSVLAGLVPLIGPVAPSYEEPNQVLERLRHACTLLGAPALLTSDRLAPSVARLGADRPRLLTLERLRAQSHPEHELPATAPDAPAFCLLSSGSGGKVKAVPLSHRNVLANNYGANRHCGHAPEDIAFNWLPFDHSGAFCDWHVRVVALGGRAVYSPTESILPSPLRWLDALDRFRATASWAPNFAYAAVGQLLTEERPQPWDLSPVRFLLSAAEPVSHDAVRTFAARLAGNGLDASAIHAAYGMTETSAAVVYSRQPRGSALRFFAVRSGTLAKAPVPVPDTETGAIRLADLGGAIPGSRVRVVDETGAVLRPGVVGHVEIGGAMVFRGYLNDEESNAGLFTADGWVRTGDLGLVREGSLHLTGREKAILIVNGMKYFASELEAAAERVDGVLPGAAACTLRVDGVAVEQLALFFCPRDPNSPPGLVDAVRERVTRETGVSPEILLPLPAAEMPRTAVGKIVRGELVRRWDEGRYLALAARTRAHASVGPTAAAPEGPVETVVLRAWQAALKRPDLGRDDDFFRLGGNSLLALQVIGRLKELFSVSLDLSSMFRAPSAGAMAALLIAQETEPGRAGRIADAFLRVAAMSTEERRRRLDRQRDAVPASPIR